MKKWLPGLIALILAASLFLTGCTAEDAENLLALIDTLESADTDWEESSAPAALDEDGHYSSKSEVGLYLYLYGHLPGNFLTKQDAQDLGWDSKEGNLWDVAPGMSIGGDRFGNYEGLLPEDKTYYECDVDYEGGYRGSKRIVFSTDGYVYYTEDHYESFIQLYP